MNQVFSDLLTDFNDFPPSAFPRPTLMEIAGYPHYENVSSNILKFFFEPDSPHGLGSLLIDALFKAKNVSASLENVRVDREVQTEAGNRLDLLIESDNYLVAIENKIFHSLANPLTDYAHFISAKAGGRIVLKIVLMLDASHEQPSDGFEVLCYSQFIAAIRSLMGHYVTGADSRYLIFLLDFLDNMENLQKGTTMSPDTYAFFVQHEMKIEALLKEVKNFRSELRSKIQQLGAIREWTQYPNVKLWSMPYCSTEKLSAALVHDIKVTEDLSVAIDTELSPGGWAIQIFTRKQDSRGRLSALLQRLSIPVKKEGDRFIYQPRFPISEDLEKVQGQLQDIVSKIATGQSQVPQVMPGK